VGRMRSGGWIKPTAIAVALAGVAASGVIVWSASYAAFSAATSTASNSFSGGAVSMSDDDSGSAMFNASGLTPASSAIVECIAVTYGGSVTAPVKLYGAAPGGTGLGTYLNLTVEMGTVGTSASCGAFSAASTPFPTATLASFAAAYTNYGNGLSTGWSPTGAAQTRVFRFTVSLINNSSANGLSCTMPFTWEAQA
jgi:hypothetical protein